MYYLTFSGVVNVILNLIFVVVFHMSVAGVALATIIAQGSNERNELRYNESSKIFSCYGAGNTQYDVAIYKLLGACEHVTAYEQTETKHTSYCANNCSEYVSVE